MLAAASCWRRGGSLGQLAPHTNRRRTRLRGAVCTPLAHRGCGCAYHSEGHSTRRISEPQSEAEKLAAARRLLGVAPAATPKDLKRAYEKEALRWHPDRHVDSGPNAQAAAAPRFQAATEALDLLIGRDMAARTGKSWVWNGVIFI